MLRTAKRNEVFSLQTNHGENCIAGTRHKGTTNCCALACLQTNFVEDWLICQI